MPNKQWRPKDWNDGKKQVADLNFSGALDSHFQPATMNEARYYSGGYEAGADAMLETLRKGSIITGEQAMKQSTSELWYRSVTCNKSGIWAFIPDEQ